MPGKYDLDGVIEKNAPRRIPANRVLPEIPHALTDEEWWASENYHILISNCVKKK